MNWKTTEWNNNITVKNTKAGGFAVLLSPGKELNAVQTDCPRLQLGQTIIVEYNIKTVSGKPKFSAIDREGPANFSVMIAKAPLEERWYSGGNLNYVTMQQALDKGKQTYPVKLRPQFWSDVNGHRDSAGFKKALSTSKIMQVVFGGKFRAHGVIVKGGTARITIKVTIT